MVLECLNQESSSVEADVSEPERAYEPAGETEKKRNKVVFGLLCVAILLALNTVYNIAVAKKGTPFLQTIIKTPFFDFAGAGKDDSLLRQEAIRSVGVIKAILHTDNNPTALVGDSLVHQGQVISGAKVIKIHRDKVEFEKDGFSWTQNIMEEPEIE